MTNPINCAVNTSAQTNTIDCEPVSIRLEPEDLVCSQSPHEDPGTAELVRRFSNAQVPFAEVALECSGELLGVGLAVASTPASNILGVLAGLKAGFEVAKCFAQEHDEALVRSQIEICEQAGGTAALLPSAHGTQLECTIEREAP